MSNIKTWLTEYCQDKWFDTENQCQYNYACIHKDGQIMLSTVEFFYSNDANDWCFTSSDVSCERIKITIPDCCPLEFWDNGKKQYMFDWKNTKIKRFYE